jgi:hypothetical protein
MKQTPSGKLMRKPVIPEPAVEHIEYASDKECLLINRFRESRLPVIGKMTSIELTPDLPKFAGGEWHVRLFSIRRGCHNFGNH